MRFIFGKDESNSKKQFEINPRLQRTQVSGNQRGLEFGSEIAKYPVVQDNIVVLPNRAVPQNLKSAPSTKRTPKKDLPSLQGVPRRR